MPAISLPEPPLIFLKDMDTKHIQIIDFNYPLPDERIAKYPLPQRDASKLLVYRKGEIIDEQFANIANYLPQGALMVFNNTRVIQARLHFRRTTGAQIEVFCLEPHTPHDYQLSFAATKCCAWTCLIGNAKKWKDDVLERPVTVGGKPMTLTARREEPCGTGFKVAFDWGDPNVSFAEVLDAIGELPIPPYLCRPTEESDLRTYQTVYSKIKGSVAAPTAGLHFTDRVLANIEDHGIDREEVTLHVGAGTFKPVKSAEIEGHTMHAEWFSVKRCTIEKLMAHGGHCIAVGTTSVRTLESLYYLGVLLQQNPYVEDHELIVPQWLPYELGSSKSMPCATEALQTVAGWMDQRQLQELHASTQIIIAPGYRYHIVSQMVTNFHQPQSTLLLLVSAFVDGQWRTIYDHALAHGYRFLSYGDSSLLIP